MPLPLLTTPCLSPSSHRPVPSPPHHPVLVFVEQGGSAISGRGADGDGGAGEAGVQASVGADGAAAEVGEGGEPLTGQFGWHMWSQAMVNGRWIDLDATLHVPFSVGHVLVGYSSMSDKEAHNNHMQMAALIGNLEIDLLSVSHEWSRQGMTL